MDRIDKIRKEIERRKGYISVTHFAEELLSFLDTLEEEPDKLLTEPDKYFEEAAEKHLDVIFGKGRHQPFYKELFIDGMKSQKEQMMKEAVEAHVVQSFNPCTEEGELTLHGVMLLYKDEGKPYLIAGEDARIIILPKED